MDKLKLTFNKTKNIPYNTIDISTKKYNKLDNKLWYDYAPLFGDDCIKVKKFICAKPFIFASNFNTYYYIDGGNYAFLTLKNKEKKNWYKNNINSAINLNKFISSKYSISLLKNPHKYFYYQMIELFTNNNFLFQENDDIFIYNEKEYDISNEIVKCLNHIKPINNFKIKSDVELKKLNQMYNNIIICITNYYDISPEYLEYSNFPLFFKSLFNSINSLKIGGNIILRIQMITTKIMADLVLIFKDFFTDFSLNNLIINQKIKYSGVFLILKEFKGISKTNLNKLNKILEKIEENDPTFNNFNIFDKKIRSRYNIWKPITDLSVWKTPISLLNIKSTNKKYDIFRTFNDKFFSEKIDYLSKLIKYFPKYYNKKISNSIREEQLTKSYWYAQNYNIEVIPYSFVKRVNFTFFDMSIFNDLFGKIDSINFKFLKNKILNNYDDQEISFKLLQKQYNEIDIFFDYYSYKEYYNIRKNFELYGNSLRKIIEHEYKLSNVSQAWMKMHEILTTFPDLLPSNQKVVNTFHICELPGSFILSVIHHATKIKNNKIVDWGAQSLNPKHKDNIRKFGKNILSNSYKLVENFPNKWYFGVDKTGDITNLENIKSYHNLCKKSYLITSDCGLGEGIRDKFKIDLLFSTILFMLNNVPLNRHCILKLYLPVEGKTYIYMVYLLYTYFENLYIYKPQLNYRSGEFYLVCMNKKNIPKSVLNSLFKKEIKDVKDSNFLLQLFDYTKFIITKRNDNLSRLLYLLINQKKITKKIKNKFNKIKEYQNEAWLKKFPIEK